MLRDRAKAADEVAAAQKAAERERSKAIEAVGAAEQGRETDRAKAAEAVAAAEKAAERQRAKANEAMKPGTPVMITVAPSKAGGVVGLLLRVTSLSGEELVTGGGCAGGRQGDPDAGRQGGAGRGGN